LYQLDKNKEGQEIFEQILFNQRGPELVADAMQLSLWQPYKKIFNRLQETVPFYGNRIGNSNDNENENGNENAIRGQQGSLQNYELWFESYYRSENISHDSFADNYMNTRVGMLTGIESRLQQTIRAGLFLGYGKPQVSNNIGRIDADDFIFGVYSRVQITPESFLNTFFAYGNQEYEYRHNNSRSRYDGDAIYASIELFRYSLRKSKLQLIPLFAVDFQKAWSDGFVAADTAQKIEKSSAGQTMLRMGLNAKYQLSGIMNFRTRLQYGVQVGGEVYGSVRTSFLSNPGESRTLTGVNLGRNIFNAGVGIDIYNTKSKHSRLFADYDIDLGERSTAHTAQLGLVTTW
jgi:hypothetical protein